MSLAVEGGKIILKEVSLLWEIISISLAVYGGRMVLIRENGISSEF